MSDPHQSITRRMPCFWSVQSRKFLWKRKLLMTWLYTPLYASVLEALIPNAKTWSGILQDRGATGTYLRQFTKQTLPWEEPMSWDQAEVSQAYALTFEYNLDKKNFREPGWASEIHRALGRGSPWACQALWVSFGAFGPSNRLPKQWSAPFLPRAPAGTSKLLHLWGLCVFRHATVISASRANSESTPSEDPPLGTTIIGITPTWFSSGVPLGGGLWDQQVSLPEQQLTSFPAGSNSAGPYL